MKRIFVSCIVAAIMAVCLCFTGCNMAGTSRTETMAAVIAAKPNTINTANRQALSSPLSVRTVVSPARAVLKEPIVVTVAMRKRTWQQGYDPHFEQHYQSFAGYISSPGKIDGLSKGFSGTDHARAREKV